MWIEVLGAFCTNCMARSTSPHMYLLSCHSLAPCPLNRTLFRCIIQRVIFEVKTIQSYKCLCVCLLPHSLSLSYYVLLLPSPSFFFSLPPYYSLFLSPPPLLPHLPLCVPFIPFTSTFLVSPPPSPSFSPVLCFWTGTE